MSIPNSISTTVLLIDDDQTLHLWAKRNLTVTGFKLTSCYNGTDGVKVFQRFTPHIVMVDIEMPDMSGFDTCAAIRKLPNGKNIPIIMMTVTEDADRIAQAYAVGATDFVVKPVNWEILCHRLSYMIKANDNLTKLEQSDLRLSKAKQMAKLGYWEWQIDNDTLYWSDEIYSLVGMNKQEFSPTSKNFQPFIHPSDIGYVEKNIIRTLRNQKSTHIEFRVIATDYQEKFVSQHIEAIADHTRQLKGLIGTVQDITEQKNTENKIRYLAYFDETTQLPNRVFFLQFLNKTIDLAKRHHRNFALLFLDLDGFKGVNDTYGHHAGDELL